MQSHWDDEQQKLQMQSTFSLFDGDNSGYIDVDELAQLLVGLGVKCSTLEITDMVACC